MKNNDITITITDLKLEESATAKENAEHHARLAGRIAIRIGQLESELKTTTDAATRKEITSNLEALRAALEYHRQATVKWTVAMKMEQTTETATDTETTDTETRAEYPAIYEAEGKQIEEGATLYHIDPDNPLDYISGKVIEIEPALNQAFVTIQTARGNLADYYQTFSFEPPAACGYWRSCLNL